MSLILVLPLERLEDVLLDGGHVGEIGAKGVTIVCHGVVSLE